MARTRDRAFGHAFRSHADGRHPGDDAKHAKAVGWDNDVGTLQLGRYGDVLLVDGNPLDDVRILQDRNKITAIFKGGEEVDRSPVPERPRMTHERGFAVSSKRLRRDRQTQAAYASQY